MKQHVLDVSEGEIEKLTDQLEREQIMIEQVTLLMLQTGIITNT